MTAHSMTARVLVSALALVALLGGASLALAQVSDDFSGAALNGAVWSFIDPLGDSSYAQVNGQLTISVPGGTSHDVWTAGNDAARVMQPVGNTDLDLEVKFESTPTLAYQMQGLVVEAGPADFLRLEFYHDGTQIQLFGAAFTGGVPTILGSVVVPAAAPLWMRVARGGNDFVVEWSADGAVWLPGLVFTQAMTVGAVGVYAGNVGAPAPAFSAVVDYFFDAGSPIDPEDGGLVDVWPPVIGGVTVTTDPGAGTALVTCTTSESATALLSWGLDTNYGTDVAGVTGDGLQHTFTLAGLATGTTYHFRITAADTLANSASTPDNPFELTDDRPEIVVWGGLSQRVGHLGTAQTDFNLMGHVVRWETLATLTYSLNGGAVRPLNWGFGTDNFGDHRRLARNGHFNVDLPIGELQPGANTITVHAVDQVGGQDLVDVTVTLETGSTPLPLTVDWETVAAAQDAGQLVDGDWTAGPAGLRTAHIGYDRMFLLGETTWQDYEVTCAVTIHEVESPTGPMSDGAGLGFIMRFTGHVVGGFRNFPPAQPKWGYQPYGALSWLRWSAGAAASPDIQFYRGDSDMTQNFGVAVGAGAGTTWRLRARCETLPDAPGGAGVTRYSFKVWPAGGNEPAAWNYEVDQVSPYALRQGSLALLAHHVDVTFDDIAVAPVQGAGDIWPPVISAVVVTPDPDTGTALVTCATSEPATTLLSWGLDANYGLDVAGVTSNGLQHAFTLTGLVPDTTYNFRITATDTLANAASTGDATFVLETPPVAGVVSDDFSAAALNGAVWSFIDPLGDSSYVQANGRLTISVPGGTSHDVWTNVNDAARVMQPVGDADLDLEVKFESVPTTAYQMQGLLVEAGPADFLRLDFYHDGTQVRMFGAVFTGGVPSVLGSIAAPAVAPLWLRVARTGDNFVAEWSADGSAWQPGFVFTHAMVVGAVGVFAGNAGAPAPAFSAVVDYFFDADSPIVPEDGGVADVWPPVISAVTVTTDADAGTALVTCTTSEPATALLSWGLDANYGADVAGVTSDSLQHAFTLTGLATGTTYHFRITAADTLANAASTGDATFVLQDPLVAGVVSDDFSTAALNGAVWSFIDPLGDSSYVQANGQLTISVPGGTSHDLWTSGNDAARVMQPVGDADLDLEVKFESLPVNAYQMQGLLIEAGPADFLRLEFVRNTSQLQLFCATFNGGVPTIRGTAIVPNGIPLWLRIARTGDDFVAEWSADGAVWQPGFAFTHAMVVGAVGVYAGNFGSPAPAFSAVVDYFFDAATPIVPEDGGVADVWPPVISAVTVMPDAGAGTALVTCTTSEPATALLSWGPDANYGTDVAGVTSNGLQHAFELTGLAAGATYHFRITAADTLANAASTGDATFVLQDPLVAGVVSDDFSAAALNGAVWSFIDPLGDSSYAQAGGLLTISVPAGTSHDLWTSGNDAARVMQPVGDADLDLEVKFESLPMNAYQMQGVLIEAGPADFLRLEFMRNATQLQLFCATFNDGVPTVRGTVAVTDGTPLWLRVTRTGDAFVAEWSADGLAWQPGFALTHAMAVGAVGVYAGNFGSPAPAFSAVVDYFFDVATPIDPEDGGLVDVWPPVISGITVTTDPGAGTALVTCTTSEPATTLLSWGLDTGYGTDVPGVTGDGLQHTFTLAGLAIGTTYHFRITATDTLANSGSTPDATFEFTDGRPDIVVWGGLAQRVGHLGTAQADFNLMGRVVRWETLATLTYSLNGGAVRPLNWGFGTDNFGDHRRLARNGHFNVDLPISELQPGANTITVHAVDQVGGQDLVDVTVTLETGSAPLPLTVDWETVAVAQDAGQMVDGDWTAGPAGLRTAHTGYDRLFLLGETTWQDYDVTCTVTIHEVEATTGPQSGAAGLGFIMRFTGHVVGGFRNFPAAQPKWGYQPFGSIAWLRWNGGAAASPDIQFHRGDADMVQDYGVAPGAIAGTTWRLRARCATLPDAPGGAGVTQYSFKVWPAGDVEPSGWNYQVEQESVHALRQGSLGLLAHHVDVTFGDIAITPLGYVADAGNVTPAGPPALAGAYPNPFNPRTTIAFELPAPARARLTILDLRGRHVVTLVESEFGAGRHEAIWSGVDDHGRAMPSGPYFCRLQAGGSESVTKLLLVR
jgi:regulation of enolase protein 1 (concanavalin A-like superfamily)